MVVGGAVLSLIAAFVFATQRGESGTGEYRAQPPTVPGVELLIGNVHVRQLLRLRRAISCPHCLNEAKISIQEEARHRGLRVWANWSWAVEGSVGLGMENLGSVWRIR